MRLTQLIFGEAAFTAQSTQGFAAVYDHQRTADLAPRAALLLTVLIAGLFTLLPWESISGQGFPDRDAYLATIHNLVTSGRRNFEFDESDLLSLVLNEYAWREILTLVAISSEDPDQGFTVLSFIATAILAFFVIRKAGAGYGVLFMFAPLTIDLVFSQTRSALALGLFVTAVPIRSTVARHMLFAVAALTHTFALVLWILYFCNQLLRTAIREWPRGRFVIALLAGVVVSVVWVYLSQEIFTALGDRRALEDASQSTSLKFALWWIVLLVALVIFARTDGSRAEYQYAMLGTVLLSIFVFTTAFGGNAMRFLALSLPLICVTIRSFEQPLVRVASIAGVVGFNVVHVSYWIL